MNPTELLVSRLGAECVTTEPDDLQHYGQDWTRFHTPNAACVVFPKTIEQVQAIVELANQEGFALVPSGGRTGLSAAAVATQNEVVVSFDRMNKILSFDSIDRQVVCQPGVITEALQEFAKEQGLFYPVDFASAGSSQIGGNVATNAGGINVIRWGMTRDQIVGMKVVTGSGELLSLGDGLIKNNTGYDLSQLMIGSEGTLGFIVELTIKLARPPVNQEVLVLGTPDFVSMMNVFAAFQKTLDLTAFEFFSEPALRQVLGHSDIPRPFETPSPYYALLEYERINDEIEAQVMETFETCMEQGWVEDGVLSQSEQQREMLWACRERISESITPRTPYKNDISVVPSKVPEFLHEIDTLIKGDYPEFEVIWFGHIGDGNLHLNILRPVEMDIAAFKAACAEGISDKVYQLVEKYKGSISAEHGVGLLKKDSLLHTRSEAEVSIMRAIKNVFDPNGVMNPGKIFEV